MTLQYSSKNNPRVIIIQKLYGKYFNKEEDLIFPKHRFKKFIKDVVNGTVERNEVINEEIKNFLKDYGKSYYSRVCIQDIESNKCGYFCIMFLKSVNDYDDYVNFINQFE